MNITYPITVLEATESWAGPGNDATYIELRQLVCTFYQLPNDVSAGSSKANQNSVCQELHKAKHKESGGILGQKIASEIISHRRYFSWSNYPNSTNVPGHNAQLRSMNKQVKLQVQTSGRKQY